MRIDTPQNQGIQCTLKHSDSPKTTEPGASLAGLGRKRWTKPILAASNIKHLTKGREGSGPGETRAKRS